jgi:hypothetical protein
METRRLAGWLFIAPLGVVVRMEVVFLRLIDREIGIIGKLQFFNYLLCLCYPFRDGLPKILQTIPMYNADPEPDLRS